MYIFTDASTTFKITGKKKSGVLFTTHSIAMVNEDFKIKRVITYTLEEGKIVGDSEYHTLMKAIELADRGSYIFTDSESNVRKISLEHEEKLREKSLTLFWVSREYNKVTDALCTATKHRRGRQLRNLGVPFQMVIPKDVTGYERGYDLYTLNALITEETKVRVHELVKAYEKIDGKQYKKIDVVNILQKSKGQMKLGGKSSPSVLTEKSAKLYSESLGELYKKCNEKGIDVKYVGKLQMSEKHPNVVTTYTQKDFDMAYSIYQDIVRVTKQESLSVFRKGLKGLTWKVQKTKTSLIYVVLNYIVEHHEVTDLKDNEYLEGLKETVAV